MRIRKLVIFLFWDFSFEKSFNSALGSCTDCRFFFSTRICIGEKSEKISSFGEASGIFRHIYRLIRDINSDATKRLDLITVNQSLRLMAEGGKLAVVTAEIPTQTTDNKNFKIIKKHKFRHGEKWNNKQLAYSRRQASPDDKFVKRLLGNHPWNSCTSS